MRKVDPVVECIAAAAAGISISQWRKYSANGNHVYPAGVSMKTIGAFRDDARRIKRALCRAGMLKEDK